MLHDSEMIVFDCFMSRDFLVFLASMSMPKIEENIYRIGSSKVTGRTKSTSHILTGFKLLTAHDSIMFLVAMLM